MLRLRALAGRGLLALAGSGLCSVTGCGSDGSTPPQGAAGTGGIDASQLPYEPCPVATGVGEFSITLAPDFTSAEGKVEDGVNPILIPEELASEGDCRLMTQPTLLCDPGCPVATQTCAAGNQCVDLPMAHSVGAVTLTGLVAPVQMTASSASGNYRPSPARLPHPAFEPGADLRLSASGGDYEAFELRGWGVSLLELSTSPVSVEPGSATQIEWSVPEEVGPARVQILLDVNNHGSSNAWIECSVPDTGSAEIPATLIDGLIAQGTSGFPTITLTRRTATSTQITPGCVHLLVASSVSTDVALAGLISCNDSSMCPDGRSCRPLERYCE